MPERREGEMPPQEKQKSRLDMTSYELLDEEDGYEEERYPALYYARFLAEAKKLSRDQLSTPEFGDELRSTIISAFRDREAGFSREELQELVDECKKISPTHTDQAIYDVFTSRLATNPSIYGESWDNTEAAEKSGIPMQHIIAKSRDHFVSEYGVEETPEKIREAKKEAIILMLIIGYLNSAAKYLEKWELQDEEDKIMQEVEEYLLQPTGEDREYRPAYPWGVGVVDDSFNPSGAYAGVEYLEKLKKAWPEKKEKQKEKK